MLIAAALLGMLATPAAAQHIDTSLSERVVEEDGTVSCRFTAIPELQPMQMPDGRQRWLWARAALEHDSAARRYIALAVWFLPASDGGSAASSLEMLSIINEHEAFARPVAAARLLIDGKDSGLPLRLEGTLRTAPGARNTLRLRPGPGQGPQFATLLIPASSTQLDLLDADGAIVRSFHWDVRSLRRVTPLLDRVDWKCGGAIGAR
ncbi:MAG: hypothetical protein V4574_14895 [Pseudomonadota bacterium]